ncbi:MAG: hypothetical protein AAGG57_11440 [Pseudomonadota bacterium]
MGLQPVNEGKQGKATTSYVVFGVIGSAIANESPDLTEDVFTYGPARAKSPK